MASPLTLALSCIGYIKGNRSLTLTIALPLQYEKKANGYKDEIAFQTRIQDNNGVSDKTYGNCSPASSCQLGYKVAVRNLQRVSVLFCLLSPCLKDIMSAGPVGFFQPRPIITLERAREESKLCMMGAVREVFAKTGHFQALKYM